MQDGNKKQELINAILEHYFKHPKVEAFLQEVTSDIILYGHTTRSVKEIDAIMEEIFNEESSV